MLSHREARTVLSNAYRIVMVGAPSLPAIQIAQAIALYESGYGSARFYNHVEDVHVSDTNNWGSIHCGDSPPCPPDCFEATDTRADGTKYLACFRQFDTAAEGALVFVRELYQKRPTLLAAANRGDIRGVVKALRATKYAVASEDTLGNALRIRLAEITKALGESNPAESPGGVRWKLALGLSAAAVAVWFVWPLVTGPDKEPDDTVPG